MTKQLLDVGNCDPDHSSIRQMLESHFDVQVTRAYGLPDALRSMRSQSYDLVTVNRLMDHDGSEGLEIIKRIKSDPALAAVPVMMITNFDDHQALAVDAGAAPGFGKAHINAPETIERLQPFLQD